MTVRGALADGDEVSVSGTLSGPQAVEKIVDVDGYDVDLMPTDHMAFLALHRPPRRRRHRRPDPRRGRRQHRRHAGRPRDAKGGDALVALTVDSGDPGRACSRDRRRDRRRRTARAVDLTE